VLRTYTAHYNAEQPIARSRSPRPNHETQPIHRPTPRSNATICSAASSTNTEPQHEPSFETLQVAERQRQGRQTSDNSGNLDTERPRNRTELAVGCTTVPVLKNSRIPLNHTGLRPVRGRRGDTRSVRLSKDSAGDAIRVLWGRAGPEPSSLEGGGALLRDAASDDGLVRYLGLPPSA
jgi:hypothetical protein